jgi:signal-transduction protein with cAMP-binding, CBS, and nucleotidyltransferase domain
MHGNHQSINIEALLAHVPLFNGLDAEEIARIARGTREVNVARGDMLFHKGDASTGFHLIVYGQIKLDSPPRRAAKRSSTSSARARPLAKP